MLTQAPLRLPDMSELSESHSAEAVNATAVAQEAIEKARQAQLNDAISQGLDSFFNHGITEKKFIDIGRIPFICDDIRSMHGMLTKMDSTLSLVSRLVFGFVIIILLGVAGVAGTVMIKVLSS